MPSIVRSSFWNCCCVCWALLSISATSSAAIISYDFRVSENFSVLQDPNNTLLQQQAVQTTVQALIIARDMPYFQLINTSSDPLASLTSLRLTIPDDRPNNFDYVSWIFATPGVSYTVNQPDTVNNGLRSKFIDLTFSGLTTGKSVIFRADIDWTFGDPNFQTDYRTALFSANSTGPTTNNALLDVGFNNDPLQSDSRRLPNFTSNGTVYTCICFRNPAQVDHVKAYSVAQAIPVAILVIPEPGPIAILALMLGGAWWWHRRMKEMTRQG
jgi:hypothetical protein